MRRTRTIAGEACFEIEISPVHLNRHGTVHGGVLMAMLDTAGLWAVSDPDGDVPPKAVTVSLNCSFVGRSETGDSTIQATGRISKQGRKTYFCSIVAESYPSGQLVATGQGIYNKIE
jgi:acyl-coenzyme A thioesterase 13